MEIMKDEMARRDNKRGRRNEKRCNRRRKKDGDIVLTWKSACLSPFCPLVCFFFANIARILSL